MKLLNLLTALSFSFCTYAQSGDIPFHPGAASGGMGLAQTAYISPWASHYNPGLMPWMENGSFAAGIENRFLTSELMGQGFAGVLPFNNSAAGLSFVNHGFSTYQRSRIGASYGLKLSDYIALGVGINYDMINFGDIYGKSQAISASVGFTAKLSDDVMLAANVFNPTRSQFSENSDESIPTILSIGGRYHFSDKMSALLELEKDINFKPSLKIGIEYLPHEIVFLRAGFKTQPNIYSFGLGVKLKDFRIDMSTWVHPVLGTSPMLSLRYDLAPKTEE